MFTRIQSITITIVFLLSFIILAESTAYYFAKITSTVSLAIAFLSVPVGLWIKSKFKPIEKNKTHRIPAKVWLSSAIIIFILFLAVTLISQGVTTEAIRSPWNNISPSIFLSFFIIFLLLFSQLFRGKERSLSILLLIATLFVFLSITSYVYPIGFGFDSFIHKTTEEHIANFGTITPKPFYYIGQYSLVVFTHHVFGFQIDKIDTWLLPILTALLLPLAWFSAATYLTENKSIAAITLSGIFLVPLSSFITTTPQSLANLWILLILLLSIPFLTNKQSPKPKTLLLPALAALAIHPIAGIPIIFFILLMMIKNKIAFWTTATIASIALPVSFVVNSVKNTGTVGIDWSKLNPTELFGTLNLNLFFENRFNPILDFAYLYGFNAILILFLISITGWWIYREEKSKKLKIFFVMIIIIVINYSILKSAVDFSFLIDYERQNYSDRLIPIFAFFLIPFFILGLGKLFEQLRESPMILRASAVFLFAATATSALYLTYPREDAYGRNAGFNVSQSDISAVYEIEDRAKGHDYIVLANQSVSAAAIRKLGFKAYYDDIFFYPIPTGGKLYQFFLEMNEKPTRETALAALDLVEGVDTVFYVVNDYWWESSRLIETAKNTSDSWFAIDNEKIHIFRFNNDNPKK